MLRQTVNCVKYRLVPQIRNQSTVANAETTKWDLFVGVQIERLPIITKTLTKLERDYQELLTQLEFENSYKSDFELKEQRDVAYAQSLKEGKLKVDLDGVAQQTALDLKDLWKTERSRFQPASRTTEADEKNDMKSTNRKLDHPLTLIMEQKLGNEKLFLLPQGKISNGETLYDAAQRIIKELCGDTIQTSIYGRAPCGFYKYKYPKEIRGEFVGAKVFFYRAILKSGQVDAKHVNFEWLNKEELLTKVDKYSNYKRSISKFII
ncbi:39S ribosomal protein L46, mitochondrial [Sitodiplosis mosellana]|uniref:39S ribosomal protein L46, mitochondrial n=1 Tax=Sitodiplosis mosellana TaxID=263140 RepID=UPI00244381FD|nr:39S ribosomal protein L46, mitochondrial [Sitodiplosis mosellana]